MNEHHDVGRLGLGRLAGGLRRTTEVVSAREEQGCHVVTLRGELDLYTGPPVRRTLAHLAEHHPHARVVIDMTELTFLDSSGLGVLIGGLRRLRATGGAMHLAGCRGPVREVLTITGLHHAFPLHDTVERALTAARTGDGGHTDHPRPPAEPLR